MNLFEIHNWKVYQKAWMVPRRKSPNVTMFRYIQEPRKLYKCGLRMNVLWSADGCVVARSDWKGGSGCVERLVGSSCAVDHKINHSALCSVVRHCCTRITVVRLCGRAQTFFLPKIFLKMPFFFFVPFFFVPVDFVFLLTSSSSSSSESSQLRTICTTFSNASFTLMSDFADVSMNANPLSSANFWPFSVETFRLESKSHLFPHKIIGKLSVSLI
mmetsp:Transcript_9219/g.34067  ORF Transcript_9219/g.34067 Transcript_9219/m.34067 type:complete len:215 (+) Transcript_9219:903-1547(+)